MAILTVGVLALQGGFEEHLSLLQATSSHLSDDSRGDSSFAFIQVRNPVELSQCDALIIPGGESTTIALIAAESGLLEPLREFVKVQKKPTWGTCAGLILLSDQANATKKGGQDLIGGLSVRVHRNHFGRQIESFQTDLHLPFLPSDQTLPYPGVFIRAPVVEKVLFPEQVEVLAKLPNRVNKMYEGKSIAETSGDAGDIIAVREGNVFGTSFHPELTTDVRIHAWWLGEVMRNRAGT